MRLISVSNEFPSDSSLFARPSPKVRAGKKKRSCLSAAREPHGRAPVYQPTRNEHDVYPRVRTGAHQKAPECRRPGSHRPMGWRASPRELQKRHRRGQEGRHGHPQRPKPPFSPSLPSSLVPSLAYQPIRPPSWVIYKPSNRSFARSSPRAIRKLWSSGSSSASLSPTATVRPFAEVPTAPALEPLWPPPSRQRARRHRRIYQSNLRRVPTLPHHGN
jgi:hypothetical protein